jgi:hypothetical protein
MANTTIAIKKSGTPAAVPAALANGELAINYADGKLYYKNTTGQIVSISGSGGNSFGIANVDNILILSSTGNDVLNFRSGNGVSLSACSTTRTITFNGTTNVPISPTAPSTPVAGDVWWNSNLGSLFIYYNDGDSSQWIEAVPTGGTTAGGSGSDAAAFTHANAAFDQANNSYVNANNAANSSNSFAVTIGASSNAWANSLSTIDRAIANAAANSANSVASASYYTIANGTSAFAKANAALANSTGTFAGDLRVTGNVVTNTINSMSGFIDLGPGSRPSYLEGRIYYDNVDKSLTVFNNDSNFVLPLGQKEFVKVLNNSGATINRGQPVYATGFHATSHHHITIGLADASDAAKYDVIGLAGHDILNGDHGYVIVRGWIGGFDTSGLTQGQRFHLGFASPGTLVTTSPEYPNYPYDIGYCIVSDATNGFLYVDRQSHTQESIRVLNGARIGGDMTVEGDFTVLGTQTVTSTSSLSVGTQYIYLSAGDSIPNSNITFTGTGLNDLSFKGHYEGIGTTTFYVKITGSNVDGEYFTWSYNNFVSNVATNTKILYQTSQPLSNGISVYFQANTGHTVGDTWNASVTAVSTDSGFVTNHTDPGRYTHAGMFRDATDGTFKFFNTYDAEPAGNIDIANSTFSLGNVQVLKITADEIFAGATEIGGLVPLSYDTANAAYSAANTKLSNTSGVAFIGSLYFPSGNIAIGSGFSNYPLTIVSGGVTPLAGLTGALATAEGTVNGTNQFNLRNAGAGSAASSDYIATSNDGSETTNFIDLGINNSGYNAPAFWTINGPRDGYLYMPDGNLSIGVANTTATYKFVNFFLGGALAADEVMRLQDSAGGANVGIGTTSPDYKLCVTGTINAANILVNQVPVVSNAATTLFTGTSNNTNFVAGANAAEVITASIGFVIDGGGAVIEPGQKGHIEVPFSATINQWTMLLDQTGSANVEIWKESYANFPPTNGDTINTGGFQVSTGVKNQGSLFNTSSTINAGDILAYNVATVDATTRLTISLKVTKT